MAGRPSRGPRAAQHLARRSDAGKRADAGARVQWVCETVRSHNSKPVTATGTSGTYELSHDLKPQSHRRPVSGWNVVRSRPRSDPAGVWVRAVAGPLSSRLLPEATELDRAGAPLRERRPDLLQGPGAADGVGPAGCPAPRPLRIAGG